MATTKQTHQERIKQQLKAAGVSKYGLIKTESRHLAEIIHPNEHIHGAVYGITKDKYSAMLVATENRIIFFDNKPLYSTFDELTYDVVAGAKMNKWLRFASITLNTRLGDYNLRYVNLICAKKFLDYVETRRLEHDAYNDNPSVPTNGKKAPKVATLSPDTIAFLNIHELGVFSTVDQEGIVHGAAVYYYVPGDGQIYIITKTETEKAHNIFRHKHVALTIYDEDKLQTLQLQGEAVIESDPLQKQLVYQNIVKTRKHGDEKRLPPVTQLEAGAFMVIRIMPKNVKYSDFKK